jgi:hypothetical protein
LFFVTRILFDLMFLLSILASCSVAIAIPHSIEQRQTTIAHDAVVGFPQAVANGEIDDLYLAYKPYLYVANGCVPFPAVNVIGQVS